MRRTLTVSIALLGLLVGLGSVPTLVGSTETPGEVHLAAAGDFAAGANAQAVLSMIGTLEPDVTVALGDLSYGATGAEQAWCDLVTSRVGAGEPFQLVAGNHEANGQNGNINDFGACLPNQLPGLVGTYGRQWYADVPQDDPLVRVVAVSPGLTFPDGTWSYQAGTARYAWTAEAIDGARSAGIPWVVVAAHVPCLSLGEYSCELGTDLMNLLVSKRVDLVLTGHEHLYQRTAQLALGAGCAAIVPGTAVDTDCVADTGASMTKGAGTVFVTVGTGGQTQRPVHQDDVEDGWFVSASGSATATWGVLDLRATPETLSASFARAAGATFADAFTLGGTAANLPPTASFTSACTPDGCSFDATSSADPDGTVTSWEWTFGDGSTGAGPTAQHAYPAAGSYQATLTVTDDDGATASVQRTVDVPAAAVLASDAFARTVTGGWGSADTGGTWQLVGSSSLFSVAGGAGVIAVAPGRGPDVALAVSSAATDLTLAVASDAVPDGGGAYYSVSPRRTATGAYHAKVTVRANGGVQIALARKVGAAETALTSALTVAGLTVSPGTQLQVRVQAYGTGPTTLRARVWRAGTPEPSAWQVQATDATVGLQAPGGVGLNAYLSSSATRAVTVRVDDLLAVTLP